jgi:hypothetical protein
LANIDSFIPGESEVQVEESKLLDVPLLKSYNGIPEFWYTALSNHKIIKQEIHEKDIPILKKVKDIQSETTTNKVNCQYILEMLFCF